MLLVFVTGVVAIALGARTRGDDVAFRGLAQMLVGIALCVLAVSITNGSRDARIVLVVVLTGAAVMASLIDLPAGRRYPVFGIAGSVIALLTFPGASRGWFGDLAAGAGDDSPEADLEELQGGQDE
jgi:di/tricarboxylate transporter